MSDTEDEYCALFQFSENQLREMVNMDGETKTAAVWPLAYGRADLDMDGEKELILRRYTAEATEGGTYIYHVYHYDKDSRDYTEQIKDAITNEEKDLAFLQIIKQALVRGVTTTVYLCGEGFDGNWFEQSTKALCLGRRVFMVKHLFACGAVYLCENEKHQSGDAVVFAQNVTISQIGLVVHHHGRDMFCPLIMDGKPWKDSHGEIEIFVSGVNGLSFEVRNRSGIKKASIRMPLEGMKKDPDFVYKLRVKKFF